MLRERFGISIWRAARRRSRSWLTRLFSAILPNIANECRAEMRHPIVVVIGYVLMGAVFIGLALTVIAAAHTNHPFYGINYKGLLLGTYSTLAVLVIAGVVGVVWVSQRVLRLVKRLWSATSSDR